MKRTIMLLAAGIAALVLNACSLPNLTTQTPAQLLAAAKTNVGYACNVANPVLDSLDAMADDSTLVDAITLSDATDAAANICTAIASIDVSSLRDFAKTAAPAAISVVASASLSDDKKKLYEDGLLTLQVAVTVLIAQYDAASAAAQATADAASTASAAGVVQQ